VRIVVLYCNFPYSSLHSRKKVNLFAILEGIILLDSPSSKIKFKYVKQVLPSLKAKDNSNTMSEFPRNSEVEKPSDKTKRDIITLEKYTKFKRAKMDRENTYHYFNDAIKRRTELHSSPFYYKHNLSYEENANTSGLNMSTFGTDKISSNNSVNLDLQNEGEDLLNYNSGIKNEKEIKRMVINTQKPYRFRHLSALQGRFKFDQDQQSNLKGSNKSYLSFIQETSNDYKPAHLPPVNKGVINLLPLPVKKQLNGNLEGKQDNLQKDIKKNAENNTNEEEVKVMKRFGNITRGTRGLVRDGPRGYLFKDSFHSRTVFQSPEKSFEEKTKEFNTNQIVPSLSQMLAESTIEKKEEENLENSKLNDSQKEENIESPSKRSILKSPEMRKFSMNDEASLERKWKESFYTKYSGRTKTNSLYIDTEFTEDSKRVSFATNQIEEHTITPTNKMDFEKSKKQPQYFINIKNRAEAIYVYRFPL